MEGKITFFAYNMGLESLLVNGPGISLRNLLTFLRNAYPKLSISIFLNFPTKELFEGISIFSINNKKALKNEIEESDLVHCWSGLKYRFIKAIKTANNLGKPVILGPNLFDGEYLSSEKEFLASVEHDLILSANPELKQVIADAHSIDADKIFDFMVGPDMSIWSFEPNPEDYILWKGNSNQAVKDISFAKNVAARLPEYKFVYLGEGSPYKYREHISKASKAALYINTSAHETKGLAQLEQMAAGVPSITHNAIYCRGIDGETGFVVPRTVDEYVNAVCKVMKNPSLRQKMRPASRAYVQSNFSSASIVKKYMELIKIVC